MIIGISGLAGSGKDTVADIILKKQGVVKIALADPTKRFAMNTWQFSYTQLWGSSSERSKEDLRYPKKNGGYLTPREVLQHQATEGARYLDEDVWVRYALNIANTLLKDNGVVYTDVQGLVPRTYYNQYLKTNFDTLPDFPAIVKAVVISDIRFENELKFIKDNGGFIIKVVRPGAGLDGEFAKHQSETEQLSFTDDLFNKIINNSGTLQDLKHSVDNLLNELNI